MSDHKKRIAAIEAKLNAKYQSAFRILLIEGGLPGPIMFATAGEHHWKRDADEDLEKFIELSATAALAFGEAMLIVGGLSGYSLEELGFASFDEWWNTLVAPDYPEVPPVEEPRWSAPARRSRLGYSGD